MPIYTEDQQKQVTDQFVSDVSKSYDAGYYSNLYKDSLGKMKETADTLLTGEIPQDVKEITEQVSAENALNRGLGVDSQASRNLTARDLGLTSLSLVQAGLETQETVARLAEARREFDQSYKLNVSEYLNNVRAADLSEAELSEERRQFNAKMTLSINQMIQDSVEFASELAYKYRTTEDEGVEMPQDATDDITNLITDLSSLIDTTTS